MGEGNGAWPLPFRGEDTEPWPYGLGGVGEGFDGAALAPTVDHFTISNVNETVAPTLSSPGAIGVDFSDASIARAIMGMG